MPAFPALSDLKAPTGDGEILVWPPADEFIAAARDNSRMLEASTASLQGVALPEIRRRMRQWLGHTGGLLFVTGHQAELHHPGVWIKNAVINAAADCSGGSALHLAIDTDAPKHLDVRWPATAGSVRTMALADDPVVDVTPWSGLIATPSPAHLEEIRSAVRESASAWNFEPLLWAFLDSAKRLALDSPSLDATVVNAEHELDWSLGLRHQAMLAEPLFFSPPYLLFVHALLSQADRLANDYNAALAEYRVAAHIKSPARPMPDLARSDDRIEAPFWLDHLSSARRARAAVARRRNRFILEADGAAFDFDPDADADAAVASFSQFLREHRLRLSPRALTLTIFMRLFIADQFVHGIGGAQYDQVTDRVVARFFGIAAPRFAVATATLFFPTAAAQSRVCLPCIEREGRRLHHGALGQKKSTYLQRMDGLPRKTPERRELFFHMHQQMARAIAVSPDIAGWRARLAEAREQAAIERGVFDRELFYALQPRARLAGLIAAVNAKFAAASLP